MHSGYHPVSVAEEGVDDFSSKSARRGTPGWLRTLLKLLLFEVFHLLLLLGWLAWKDRGAVWPDELDQTCKLSSQKSHHPP